MSKPVYVKDLWQYFGYRRMSGDDASLNHQITDMNVERPGLELAGVLEGKPADRIVIIGEKEYKYIKKMTRQQQEASFEFLTHERVPMILVSRDLPVPEVLLEIAKRKNFPVFSSYAPTSSLIVEIVSFLEEYFAPSVPMHGVLMQVYGRGVLITGNSGIGKSEIALELLKKGHILVCDDCVDVYRIHNKLTGMSPEVLKNLLELRGVGIINVVQIFGAASTTERTEIECIIELEKWDENKEYDRLGINDNNTTEILGVKLPKMTIPMREGRSVAGIIETAVTNNILRQKGFNSALDFENRVVSLINSQKEEK